MLCSSGFEVLATQHSQTVVRRRTFSRRPHGGVWRIPSVKTEDVTVELADMQEAKDSVTFQFVSYPTGTMLVYPKTARVKAVEDRGTRLLRSLEKSSAATSEPGYVYIKGASPSYSLLMKEAIAGRSAMLGYVALLLSEAATQQSVLSQLTSGSALPSLAAVVTLVVLSTLAPKVISGVEVTDRQLGPVTPWVEKMVGRTAMLGFTLTCLIEASKGFVPLHVALPTLL